MFPIEIREEVRSRFSSIAAGSRDDEVKDNDDTFNVTWEQLREAKVTESAKDVPRMQTSEKQTILTGSHHSNNVVANYRTMNTNNVFVTTRKNNEE